MNKSLRYYFCIVMYNFDFCVFGMRTEYMDERDSLSRRDVLILGLASFFTNEAEAKSRHRKNPVRVREPAKKIMPDTESFTAIDAQSGQVIYQYNGGAIIRPASMSKMMTLLLGFDLVRDNLIALTDKVLLPQEALSRRKKEHYSHWPLLNQFGTVLRGAAIRSYNDLASCIAVTTVKLRGIGHSEADFVPLMNQKAREIGMMDTNFYNASGLPTPVIEVDAQGSTTRDLALLLRYIRNHYPELHTLLGTEKAESPKGQIMKNTNTLLHREFVYDVDDDKKPDGFFRVVSGKTGYTFRSGSCLTAESVLIDGRHVIASYVGGENSKHREQRYVHFMQETMKAWDERKRNKGLTCAPDLHVC